MATRAWLDSVITYHR